MIFLPNSRIIVFEAQEVSATEIYAAWEDWVLLSDNAKYPQAMRAFGGDDTSTGQRAPQYYFFMNGWHGRVMEANGTTNVTGLLYTEDGSKPVLDPVGNYKTNINYEKPLLAVAYDSSGNAGLSPEDLNAIAAVFNAQIAAAGVALKTDIYPLY